MWYSADALMRSSLLGSVDNDAAMWEECIYLLEASSESEALRMAEEIAKGEEVEYRTAEGETAKWEFDCVLRVQEISNGRIISGTELFSRFLRKAEAESLKKPFED